MGEHLVKHGDGVKDVAFTVEDLNEIVKVSESYKEKKVETDVQITNRHQPNIMILHEETYIIKLHSSEQKNEEPRLFGTFGKNLMKMEQFGSL